LADNAGLQGFSGRAQAHANDLTLAAALQRLNGEKHVGIGRVEMEASGLARIDEHRGTQDGRICSWGGG
jgi:hypothetical protein